MPSIPNIISSMPVWNIFFKHGICFLNDECWWNVWQFLSHSTHQKFNREIFQHALHLSVYRYIHIYDHECFGLCGSRYLPFNSGIFPIFMLQTTFRYTGIWITNICWISQFELNLNKYFWHLILYIWMPHFNEIFLDTLVEVGCPKGLLDFYSFLHSWQICTLKHFQYMQPNWST